MDDECLCYTVQKSENVHLFAKAFVLFGMHTNTQRAMGKYIFTEIKQTHLYIRKWIDGMMIRELIAMPEDEEKRQEEETRMHKAEKSHRKNDKDNEMRWYKYNFYQNPCDISIDMATI